MFFFCNLSEPIQRVVYDYEFNIWVESLRWGAKVFSFYINDIAKRTCIGGSIQLFSDGISLYIMVGLSRFLKSK